MNRYLLYLVLVNMLTNVVIFVPKILATYRYDGAVSSVLLSIPIGLILCLLFTNAISKFPEKGFPEILDTLQRPKLKKAVLVFFSGIWYSAGLLTIIGFTDIVNRFINPELPKVALALFFAVTICFIAQFSSVKVMYLMEIILVLNVPILIFIIFKAFTSDYLSWNSIFEIGTHLFVWPNLKALAAATYTFSGYMNVLIINRLFKEKIKKINIFIILFLSIFNLFTTFFIPIGFHGADGTQEYLYPWITTADCLRIPYGAIERGIFVFLILYISITIISAGIHWHVAYEFLKGSPKVTLSMKKKFWILAVFCGIVVIFEMKTTPLQTITLSTYWLIIRFIFELFVVIGIWFLSRRQEK